MEVEIRKQQVTRGYIERFWDNLSKAGKDKITLPYLKTRLALLDTYWQRFEDTHYQLLEYENLYETRYNKEDSYTSTENNYVDCKSKINSLIQGETPAVGHNPASAAASVIKYIQLPMITLPTFSGEQLEWESFRDLFRSLVGDVSDLAPVQKLQYLEVSLTGEAAAIVANVDLSDKGFELAWADLTSRYDNKRVLLAAHMRALLSSAAITKPSSTELKRLISVALQARRFFASLGRPISHWDDWFVHVIVEKLNSSSRLFWEASLQTSSEFPTFSQLQDYLQTRIRALDAASAKHIVPPISSNAKTSDRRTRVNALATTATGSQSATKRCSLCQGNHLFNYCARFKELAVPQRREHVKKQGACFNCLKLKHNVHTCPSALRCLRCQSKHHTLLHLTGSSPAPTTDSPEDAPTPDPSPTVMDTPASPAVKSNTASLTASSGHQVLLSTALMTCSNQQGDTLIVRALLDSGSEATFISERVAQTLNLPQSRVHVLVSGIQGKSTGVVHQSVALTIGSTRDASLRCALPSVLVLPRLTSELPSHKIQRQEWPHLRGLELADPRFDQPARVDAILGPDVYGLLLREGLKMGAPGTPSAQLTALGWILMGPASLPAPMRSDTSAFSALPVSTECFGLDHTLQRFWALEEVPSVPTLSSEDLHCESYFAATLWTHGLT